MNQNPWEIPGPSSPNSPGPNAWDVPAPDMPQAPPSKKIPGKKGRGKKVLAIIAAFVVAIAGATAAYFVPGMLKPAAAMSYISAKDPGPDPFMDTPSDPEIVPRLEGLAAPGHSPQRGSADGHDPNIYGGSGSLSVCDAEKLIGNLSADEQLNKAFAAGVGITAADVPRFIRSLEPLILMQDTWVTNHGFSQGKATPFQAVLQRGTGVLVDAYGVPRVRCSCGNPLAEAWSGYTAPGSVDSAWDGYDARGVATIYEAPAPAPDLNVTDLDTGFSKEASFDESQVSDLDSVRSAVTDDTPMTTPRDMGVKPDSQMLRDNGLAEAGHSGAESDRVRPTGGGRFSDFDKWIRSGNGGVKGTDESGTQNSAPNAFPDWRSQTKPVDPAAFSTSRIQYGNNFIPFPDHGVGCFVDDSAPTITCHITSLIDAGLTMPSMQRHNAANTSAAKIDMLQVTEGNEYFSGLPSNTDSPLYAYSRISPLEPGQSVKIGDFECFNLGDSMGCEAPKSRFFVDKSGKAFVDDSTVPLGHVCGEVTDKRSGARYDVVVYDGAVDCDQVSSAATDYVNSVPSDGSWKNTMQHFGDWQCHTAGNDGPEDDHKLGDCYDSAKMRSKIEIRSK
nr:DUF6777 domain-containing protein [Corynebacterium lactis]